MRAALTTQLLRRSRWLDYRGEELTLTQTGSDQHRLTHRAVLTVTHFSQVHPRDHAQPRRQPLQQEADDGGAQQNPEQLQNQDQNRETVVSEALTSDL